MSCVHKRRYSNSGKQSNSFWAAISQLIIVHKRSFIPFLLLGTLFQLKSVNFRLRQPAWNALLSETRQSTYLVGFSNRLKHTFSNWCFLKVACVLFNLKIRSYCMTNFIIMPDCCDAHNVSFLMVIAKI